MFLSLKLVVELGKVKNESAENFESIFIFYELYLCVSNVMFSFKSFL